MVSTSNEGIMPEYLLKYGISKQNKEDRSPQLLETLYMAERFRAGNDLKPLREIYDNSVWDGVSANEIARRLASLDEYMKELARDRATMWGVTLTLN